jgi:hypothetical protein
MTVLGLPVLKWRRDTNFVIQCKILISMWFRFMVFIATFNNISIIFVVVSFIGGRNQSSWRKPPTCRKSLTNFIFLNFWTPTVGWIADEGKIFFLRNSMEKLHTNQIYYWKIIIFGIGPIESCYMYLGSYKS